MECSSCKNGPLWEAIPDIYVSQACEVGGFYGERRKTH